MQNDHKVCSSCKKKKILSMDFYLVSGKYKSACKACVIKRNGVYQKKMRPLRTKAQKKRKRAYSRAYYEKNKDVFMKYRQTFREKHPGYGRKKKEQ